MPSKNKVKHTHKIRVGVRGATGPSYAVANAKDLSLEQILTLTWNKIYGGIQMISTSLDSKGSFGLGSSPQHRFNVCMFKCFAWVKMASDDETCVVYIINDFILLKKCILLPVSQVLQISMMYKFHKLKSETFHKYMRQGWFGWMAEHMFIIFKLKNISFQYELEFAFFFMIKVWS